MAAYSHVHWVLAFWLVTCRLRTCKANGWIKVPHIERKCTGDDASLEWVYNHTLGTPRGVTVSRTDRVITLVSKLRGSEPQSDSPRTGFLENAGIFISNLTLEDAGIYDSTVVFPTGYVLYSEATLEVYEDCPDKEEFRNPDIVILSSIPNNLTNFSLDHSLRALVIRLKVIIPKGKPRVNCTLYIDGKDFDCVSGDATIPSNSKNDINVTVKLDHLVLGESTRTLIFTSTSDDRMTKWTLETSNNSVETVTETSTPKGYVVDGTNITSLIAVSVVLVLILFAMLLLCSYCRCRQHIAETSILRKKGDALLACCTVDSGEKTTLQVAGEDPTEPTYFQAKSTISQPTHESSLPFMVDKPRISQEETTLLAAECELQPLNVIDDESTPRIESQQSEAPTQDKHGGTPSEPMYVKNQKTSTNWVQGGPDSHPEYSL